jgi:ER-bound oxygenase mpaB/B'/Rubber oxygenase, catalytic domain
MMPTRYIFPSPGFHHYWYEGHGQLMRARLAQVPDPAEIALEVPRLFEGDPLADAVIQEVYFKQGIKAANALVEAILENGITATPDAPACLQALFAEVDVVPAWVDAEKLAIGARFCQRSGSLGLIVLRNYCLMGGYESSAINKPLIATGALKKGAAKRMAETVEFWVNATGDNALQRNEIGFKNTIKVRLMHAFARVSVQREPTWDTQAWGVPINQWDMVATNLGFSLAFMDGLRSLGFQPSPEEVLGLLHFWKYIGHLLGISPAYLPDDELQAITELYKWTITQPPADPDTQLLAWALFDEPMHSKYLRFKWAKRILCKTHLAYSYFFLGERSCRALGLPKTKLKFYPLTVRFVKRLHEFGNQRSGRIFRFSVRLGRRSQVNIMNIFLGRPSATLVPKAKL